MQPLAMGISALEGGCSCPTGLGSGCAQEQKSSLAIFVHALLLCKLPIWLFPAVSGSAAAMRFAEVLLREP